MSKHHDRLYAEPPAGRQSGVATRAAMALADRLNAEAQRRWPQEWAATEAQRGKARQQARKALRDRLSEPRAVP